MVHPNKSDRTAVDRTQTGLLFVVVLVILVGTVMLMLRNSDPRQLIEPQELAANPLPGPFGHRSSPCFTRDGTRLAMIADVEERGDSEIRVFNLATGAESSPVDHPGDESAPSWSPDGETLAFVRVFDGRIRIVTRNVETNFETEVWSLDLSGRIDPRTAPRIAWRADGNAMAFPARTNDGFVGISMYDTVQKKSNIVTRPPEKETVDLDPSFSPDGRAIAFTRYRGPSNSDLFVVGASGDVRRLTFDHRDVFGHAWYPDGSKILFGSNRSGFIELWTVGADGGVPQPTRSFGLGALRPSIAIDGTVAFERWRVDTSIRLGSIDVETGLDTVLFDRDEWEGAGRFSWNGLKVAFVTAGSGGSEIRTARVMSKSSSVVVSSKAIIDAPAWSPDLEAIAFQQRVEGRMAIIVVRVDGLDARAITGGKADDVFPAWSRDGLTIFFGSNRTGDWEIWRVPVSGGDPVQVTHHGGFRAQPSAKGSLFYSKFGSPGIWELRDDGERLVTGALGIEDATNWVVNDEAVWYIARDATRGAALHRLSFDGVDIEVRMVSPVPLAHHAGLDVSPDEASFLWTAMEGSSSSVELATLEP